MEKILENPSDLDTLVDVERFFIFGSSDLSDRLHMLLCGRFPMHFYGFLYDRRTDERHSTSQFSLRYWRDALEELGSGDYVFLVWRDAQVENALLEKGVRIGLASNLITIYGTYETPTLLHFCKRYLKKSHEALDVGGNTGLTGAIMASFAKRVTIFEPNVELIPVINSTCQGHDNISVEQKAVFNKCGTVSLYPAGHNNTTMVPVLKNDPVMVEATTIDKYCGINNLEPNFIKIDVEGVDAEVILGAEKTILSYKPFIFLELPGLNAKVYNSDETNIEKAMRLLQENYELFAYPTLDTYSPFASHFNSLNSSECKKRHSPLVPANAIGMSLDIFYEKYAGRPTNIGAVPKNVLFK